MNERIVMLELSRIEAAHLTDLVEQFASLVAEPIDGSEAPDDPAIARLVPSAYDDDDEASRDFRSVTQSGLLDRRAADAVVMLDTLRYDGERLRPDEIDPSVAAETFAIALDSDQTSAWLRTLSALRLVLATRLGIADEDDHDHDDPRFGIYDWIGYRLDGLVEAIGS